MAHDGVIATLTISSRVDKAAEGQQALVVGLLRSLSAFRWITMIWAAIAVALSTEFVERGILASILLAAMVVTTVLVTTWPRRPSILPTATGWVVAVELAIGAGMLIGDGLVYSAERPQSLPWAWPAAGIMAAGILYGTRAGVAAAVLAGSASLISEVLLLGRDSDVVSSASKLGLWMLAGALAGYVVERLRRAESEISIVRAREEVARQLHDGVLQTLAVIQRRSTDTDLAALARDQEHDLRGFLSGSSTAPEGFEPAIHRLASKYESVHGGRVKVVIAIDMPLLDDPTTDALTGAIGEALANSGKHGPAKNITIYAEPIYKPSGAGERAFISVKDNGPGFDVGSTTERIGLKRSIRGRVEEVGGRADVVSQPGRGTEVQLWV